MIPKRIVSVFAGLLMVSATLGGALPALAQGRSGGGGTPPRLAFLDGDVSFWRTGAEEWTQAQLNTPIAAGDSLFAGDNANFELEVGPRAFVRAGAATEIDLTALEPDYLQLRIPGGHAALDLKSLPRGTTIEVDSPNAAFTINRPGYYRVDIDETRTVFSARRGGAAMVAPAASDSLSVGDNQQVILDGTDNVQVNLTAAPAPDEWDRWNYDRSGQLVEVPRSAAYVPPTVAGVDDLDRYGEWRAQPRYGHVWVPRDVQPDWAPYSTGRWVYDPYYEWTWVDDSPWGWAPYHYGRWVHLDGYWGWAPGPIVARPVYAPALVAFFGSPGLGVSVSIGLPFVSWCALGFGEPIIPWWGRRGFVGQPYWGGWGGPRVVNNVVINNTRIVNVTNINHYENVNVRNAVSGVDRNQFGRGRGDHIRLDPQRVQNLRPVRGDLGVRPVASSLVAREERGRRPPEQLQARRVVTTRPAPDPMNRLRTKGFAPTASPSRPEPRMAHTLRQPRDPGAQPQGGNPPQRRGAVPQQRQAPGVSGQPQPAGGEAAHPGRPERPGRPIRQEHTQPGARGEVAPPPVPGARPRPNAMHPGVAPQPGSREQAQPPVHDQVRPRENRVAPPPPNEPRAVPRPPAHQADRQHEPAAPHAQPAAQPPPPHSQPAAREPQAPMHQPAAPPPAAPRPPAQQPSRPHEERVAPPPQMHQQAPVRQERAAPPPQAPPRQERAMPPVQQQQQPRPAPPPVQQQQQRQPRPAPQNAPPHAAPAAGGDRPPG